MISLCLKSFGGSISRLDTGECLLLTRPWLCLTTIPMTVLNSLSVEQLRKAVAIKEQIEQLEAQLGSVLGDAAEPLVPSKKRHRMSAAGRARIAAAAARGGPS